MSDTHTSAVFGLGSMGYGMASNMVKAGIVTHGYDIDPARVERFLGDGGQPGALDDVASNLDSVVVVVVNAAQVEDLLFGDGGVVAKLKPGTVVIGCATTPPAFVRKLAASCAAAGLAYLDAPISGGAVKANSGELSVMASGHPDTFAKARPVLDAISAKVFELGDEPGVGTTMKVVHQLLAGTHVVTMAEAMALGVSQGITPAQFMEVIPQCAGTSWILENRGPHVVDGDYAPRSACSINAKDLGIVMEMARDAKCPVPMAAAAHQLYMAAAGLGLFDEDDSAITKVYARTAGLDLPAKKS